MNRTVCVALATVGFAALGASALPLLRVWQAAQATPDRSQMIPLNATGELAVANLVVDLKDDATEADVRDLDHDLGIVLQPNSIVARQDRVYRVSVPAERTAQVLAALQKDRRVEAAEPEMTFSIPPHERESDDVDPRAIVHQALEGLRQETGRRERTVALYPPVSISVTAPVASVRDAAFDDGAGTRPNDPRYSEQWNFQMIKAEDAWKRTRGKGIVVAVIDTGVSGIDYKKGKACRDFNTTTFTKGYDFVNDDDQPYDDHAHGTHVAGTIAESTNNNEGVAGLAFEATIMPLKVLSGDGSGTAGDIADAIRWAADKGANVINMSLGSMFPSSVIHNACKYARKKGVVIVCAAGNSFREGVGYPAAHPECIAVSAVGPTGELAKYSSWGKEVAIAAPGGDMVDSGNPADGILQNTNLPEKIGGHGDDYYAFNGTSMASPHVAAAAALVMAQGVKDPAQVKEILTKSATPKGDKKKYGAGVLNLANATKIAAGQTGPKLRHLVLPGLAMLLMLFGGRRRNPLLRAGMALALGAGFFLPDWFTGRVGMDSAWNLLSFSAILPAALILASHRGPGLKIAATYAVGVGVNLFANWHNGSIPFTSATFGDAALPWTAVNLVVSFWLANIAGLYAARRMR